MLTEDLDCGCPADEDDPSTAGGKPRTGRAPVPWVPRWGFVTRQPPSGKLRCATETGCFVTAEDHNILGGLGSAVAESLAQSTPCPIEFVGVRDQFGASGEPEELAQQYGLTAPFIAQAARDAIARKKKSRKKG